jgi:thiol-disulfide isomerase/thioredoxin
LTPPIQRFAIALRARVATALLIAAVVAGCSGSASGTSPATGQESMAPETMAPQSMGPEMTDGSPMAPESMPAESIAPAAGTSAAAGASAARDALAAHPWATATLTDVTTGQPFTIADFAGRTVFVEAMAIWCTNCRAQQGRFTDALSQIDPDRVAYVVLTVEPSEGAEDLARYRQSQDFTGTYAVAGKDVSAALRDEFGANVLNPPSVPLITISPAGDISFGTGGESVEAIVATAAG